MPSYYEMLRDPRWQRRRLEVMQRAEFKCEICGGAEKTLNVHHRQYRKGAKPWEYDDQDLRCICEPCHQEEHSRRDQLVRLFEALHPADQDRLLGYLWALAVTDARLDLIKPLSTNNAEFADGIADVLGCSVFDVLDGPIDHARLFELTKELRNG